MCVDPYAVTTHVNGESLTDPELRYIFSSLNINIFIKKNHS